MNATRPGRETRIRDYGLLVAGLVGIGYQTVTGKVDIALLVAFMTMMGLPGVSSLVATIRGSGTTPPSSPPVPQDSSSDSGSSPG